MKVYMIYRARNNKILSKTIRLFKDEKKAIKERNKLNSTLKDYNKLNDLGSRLDRFIISNKSIDIE